MTQANELRIGNKVIYSNSNSFYTVTGIYEYGIDVEDEMEQTYMEYDCFEPIELTEEILLKCGFNKSAWDNYSTFRNLFCSDGCIVISLEHKYIEIGDLTLDIEIKYLNQLQNLYFALTNKELEIKL